MIEEQEFFVDGSLVEVLTTQPIDRLFTYKAPSKGCYKGAFVLVPLGRRKVIGLVWGASFEKFDPEKIKTIEDVLDYQPIQPELQNFIQKVADYTISPLFAVLRLVTRVRDLAAKGVEKRVIYKGKVPRSFKMTIARKRVLETLDEFDDIEPDLLMTATVNGKEWSRGQSGDSHFSFAQMITHVSQDEWVLPGDLFGSGTVGTGCGLEIDKWIQPGDEIELFVEGIGSLKNKIGTKNGKL